MTLLLFQARAAQAGIEFQAASIPKRCYDSMRSAGAQCRAAAEHGACALDPCSGGMVEPFYHGISMGKSTKVPADKLNYSDPLPDASKT